MNVIETLDAFARFLIQSGVQYRYQGRDPQNGIDCWAIPILGYARFGITLPDFVSTLQLEKQNRDVHVEAMRAYADVCRTLDEDEEWRPGDVVKFYNVQAQMIHGALIVSDTEAIHAVEHDALPDAPCVVRLSLNRLKRMPDVRAMRYTGPGAEVFGADTPHERTPGMMAKPEQME